MTSPPHTQLEQAACDPTPVHLAHFNPQARIPHGVTPAHICAAMNEFIGFIRMVNQRMHENGMARFESILMPANFSSIVGEFMSAGIPKQCATIVKNQYHKRLAVRRTLGDQPSHDHRGREGLRLPQADGELDLQRT
jgi:hypothetical protein